MPLSCTPPEPPEEWLQYHPKAREVQIYINTEKLPKQDWVDAVFDIRAYNQSLGHERQVFGHVDSGAFCESTLASWISAVKPLSRGNQRGVFYYCRKGGWQQLHLLLTSIKEGFKEGHREADQPQGPAPQAEKGPSLRYYNWEKEIAPWVQQGELLGEGGCGKVYKGCLDGHDVAIKVVTPKGTGPEHLTHLHNAAQSSLQEFNNVVRLQQDSDLFARLLGITHHPDGTLCMVSERANLGALEDIPKELYPHEGLLLFSQYAHGVARMHELRTLHGDLKPDNLLLHRKSDGSLIGRIADLGLAQILLPGSSSGLDQGGTPDFMAPELELTGLTCEVDVYAFGITMGVLFSGMDPVEVDEAAKVASGPKVRVAKRRKVMSEVEDRVHAKFKEVLVGAPVVGSLVNLVFECSHRLPGKRPAAAQVAARLEKIAGSRTVGG